MRPLTASSLAALGLAALLAVCSALGMPPVESLLLVGVSGGSALVVGALGAVALRLASSAPFGAQMAVVVTTAVAAVTVGTVATSQAMLLPSDALHSMVVAILAAGSVGGLAALVLAGQVRVAQLSLAATARRFEEGHSADAQMPPIREFASIAADLEATRQRLERSRQRERELEAARRDLIAWLSHDLRTPLAGIRALAEALEDGVAIDPETVSRYHQQLREQAERVADMVEDLFSLSHIRSGAIELERARVSLEDLLSDAVAAIEPIARRAEVRIQGNVEEGVDLDVSPPDITRILENLLSNAIRETPAGGQVTVTLTSVAGWAQVTVSDECGGIPDDLLERVFEPGFRGEAARSPATTSRGGFGLAIARGLAEVHAGTLEAQSFSGGCTFLLRLPVADQDTRRPTGAHRSQRSLTKR